VYDEVFPALTDADPGVFAMHTQRGRRFASRQVSKVTTRGFRA
jgi:hypothetical protein